ncbi:hypothetical protein [Flammeovirga pacifica]|uniref:DNA polymerase III subunit gamma/tau n=1 Tax=Flammeovirga pacifica TaxID=915059 RepID=A0A1S1YXG3_FLAPC|nr:hypothetical protein [Flammeovirga pacifica]OHX65709.1 hypothetical protein NH26_04765 [Flammeovirga pacifica]
MKAKQAKLAKKEAPSTSTQQFNLEEHFKKESAQESMKSTTQISGNLEMLKSGLSRQAKQIKEEELQQVPKQASVVSSIPPPPPSSYNRHSNATSPTKQVATFTLEQAEKVWKVFSDQYKRKGKSKFASILLEESTIDLDSQLNIIIHITNSVQTEHLNVVKPDLLRHLRSELKNDSVELLTKVTMVENTNEPKKIYSGIDKLKYLKDKYPSLTKLQQKLGLELE